MQAIEHAACPTEPWREGVTTRMLVSALTGSRQLCIFEQDCAPGLGAPMHLHAVEEVLEVLQGIAEVTLGAESRMVEAGCSVLVPAGARHGFRNAGEGMLRVRATLAAPIFEASYDDLAEIARRYVP